MSSRPPLRVLGEVGARRLYLQRGYSSLYAYCTQVLRMSEAVAYHRIKVARASRKFPAVLDRIRNGELHLSGARLLAPHPTPENQAELLELAKHKSRRAIEELLADRAPKPDAPAFIRRMQAPRPPPATPNPRSSARAQSPAPPVHAAPVPSPPSQAHHPEPLGELHDQLREAQALLRHQVPDGDLVKIIGRALTLLVREARRRKFAEVDRPRSESGSPAPRQTTRHIPAGIKRAVSARDRGRCAFVASNGRRCGTRSFLEFHHLIPWARSRQHRASSIELRCRAHNQYAAVNDFGADFMPQFSKAGEGERAPGPVGRGVGSEERTD